ncbi:MAG: hypothetical protein AAGL98_03895, partial [Planctomycetota bacterium]
MALFGKKKSKDQPAGDGSAAGGPSGAAAGGRSGGASGGAAKSFDRDPRKARRFFDHAETVAEAKNFDYAIEMYINGLRHDPDNMARHEELLDVAKRRKVSGGKKAGLKDKLKSIGPDAVAKMLDAEKLWAMDFGDASLMREFMKKAVEADETEDDLALGEVAHWIGSMALDLPGLKPRAKDYVLLADLFERIAAYDKAVQACKSAIRLDQNNADLLDKLKGLEAQNYSATQTSTDKGGFRENVADADAAMEAQQGNTRAESVVDHAIAKRRAEYEEDPEDLDRLGKYVDALLRKEAYDEEDQAMKLLARAHEQTGQYRYKVRVGDIKMKQFNRDIREVKKALVEAPGDEYFTGRLEEATKEKLDFELGEYQERVKNYPTDLKLKFELGKRMYQVGLIDDAIAETPGGQTNLEDLAALVSMSMPAFSTAMKATTGHTPYQYVL